MFSRRALIEVDNNLIVKHEPPLITAFFNCRSTIYDLELVQGTTIDTKGREAVLLLNGEKLDIKPLTLPRVRKTELYSLIKRELFYHYRDAENVAFIYTILKQEKNNLDLLVYCIDDSRINFAVSRLKERIRLKGVYLVQFCFLEYFKRKLTEKNFIFLFSYRGKLYFLYIADAKVLNSAVHTADNSTSNTSSLFFSFRESSRILHDKQIDKVYLANFQEEVFIKENMEGIDFINLGSISEKMLVKRVALKRS